VRGTPYAELTADIFAPDYAPPGGETWPEFDVRVARAWQRVSERAARTRGNLAVISHGLVCRSVVANLVPRAADLTVPDHWGNTSITVFGSAPPHAIALLNCTAHLGPLERSESGLAVVHEDLRHGLAGGLLDVGVGVAHGQPEARPEQDRDARGPRTGRTDEDREWAHDRLRCRSGMASR